MEIAQQQAVATTQTCRHRPRHHRPHAPHRIKRVQHHPHRRRQTPNNNKRQ